MELASVALFFIGLIMVIGGAEALVRGASRIAATVGVSPLVIGLTVVAFGTSAPELAVSTSSARTGVIDVAIGNIVGSNLFNILVILGASAVVAPLAVARQLIRVDLPLMVVASLLMFLLALDGRISTLEGIAFFGGVVVYSAWAIISSRRASAALVDEYEHEFGERDSGLARIALDVLLILVGLALLVLGAHWFVGAATDFARALGVSELVIGLTLVAAGTSMPELATSVVASVRGERDIAVGNVIGSNLFNILCVLGATAAVVPSGVPVSESALRVDIPVMLAVALLCIPVFVTGLVGRWHGLTFLALYCAYAGYLYLDAQQSAARDGYVTAVLVGVIPLVLLSYLVLALRQRRATRRLAT